LVDRSAIAFQFKRAAARAVCRCRHDEFSRRVRAESPADIRPVDHRAGRHAAKSRWNFKSASRTSGIADTIEAGLANL